MNISRPLLVMAVFLSGCSSCDRGEQWNAGGAGGGAKAPPPASSSGEVAPPAAVDAMGKPNAPAEAGGAPPGAPPAAQAPAQSDECVVVADVNPDFGPPPLSVSFTAEADCGEAKYKWDFGDDTSPSIEANPTHTYAKEGDYTASVTVTGPKGGTSTDEIDIFVEQE